MEYTFGGKVFKLKKNTFFLEEKIKELLGLSDNLEIQLKALKIKFDFLSKQLDKETDTDKADLILEKILGVNSDVVEIGEKMSWDKHFDKCKIVIETLTDGDSSVLTPENFGKFDAIEVFSDFFTSPTKSRKN